MENQRMTNKTPLSPLVKEIIALEKQVAPLNAVIELMEIESSFADELKLILEKNHLEKVWEELIAHSDKLAEYYAVPTKLTMEQEQSLASGNYKLINLDQVAKLVGVSPQTISRWVRLLRAGEDSGPLADMGWGAFPRPFKLGRKYKWNLFEIETFIKNAPRRATDVKI